MADNTRGGSQDAANPLIATDEVTHSGDVADVQLFRPVHITGAEGSKTVEPWSFSSGWNAPLVATAEQGGSVDAFSNASVTQMLDAGASGGAGPLQTAGMVFNGTTWDRVRSVTGALVSAAEDFSLAAGVGPGYARKITGTHVATGAGTPINVQGAGHVGIRLTGTYVATIAFEGSYDGTNYVGLTAYNVASGARAGNTTGTSQTWIIPVEGLRLVRTNASAYTSGTATYSLTAQPGESVLGVVSGDVAHDAVDSGNPVKIGGKYVATPAAVATGDRTDLLTDKHGQARVVIGDPTDGTLVASVGSSSLYVAALSPNLLESDTGVEVGLFRDQDGTNRGGAVGPMIFNGTDWQRQRTASADALAATGIAAAGLMGYNGTTWDRVRGTVADGLLVNLGANNDVTVTSLPALVAGTANIGDVDVLTVPAPLSTTGNGTAATALRVTVASDTTGVLATTPGGNVAHDAVDSGNPVKIGGYAKATLPTAVADGDRVNAWFGQQGQQSVQLVSSDGTGPLGLVTGNTDGHTAGISRVPTAALWLVYNGTTWDRARSASADALAATGLAAAGLMGYNGTTWDRVRTANTGRLQVDVITGGGGGTQYVQDAAFGTGTVTVAGARASTATPADMSADDDAVALWASRKGALNVTLRDTAGAAIATGVQYVEDVALAANAGQGTLVVARRDDALSALTPVEGDAVGLRVDANGALWTALGTALPAGTANIGDVDVLTVPSPLSTAGNGTAATAHRVTIASDSTGVIGVTDNGGSLTVDGTVAVSGAVDTELPAAAALADATANPTLPSVGAALLGYNGTTWDRVRTANTGRLQVDVITGGGGGTQYTEDAAIAANAGVGTLMVARRDDVLSALTPIEGDAVGLRVDANGALWTTASSGPAAGDVAHDAVDSGNPVKIGGRAYDVDTVVAVAFGDRSDIAIGRQGNVNTAPGKQSGSTDGSTSSSAVIATWEGTTNTAGSGHLLVRPTLFNGTSWDRVRSVSADAQAATGIQAAGPLIFNGTTWDRVRSLPAFDTAVAAPVRLGLQAVSEPDLRQTSLALGTVIGNTQSWDVNGYDSTLVHLATTQTGTFLFEVSADGTNYIAAEVFDVATDLWVSGQNLVPTANKVYRISTNAWRLLRARTISTLNGTVAMTATQAARPTIVTAIDVGPAPHNIGYNITGKTAQYATAQTGVALWTPAAGKRLVITSYQIQAGGTVGGTIQLWFGASADTTYTRGTDLAIFDGEVLPSATLKPGVVQTGVWPASVVDHILRVTNTGTINPLTFSCWGYEV